MLIYSRIIQAIGYIHFIIALSFTFLGLVFPYKIVGGTFLNSLGGLLLLPCIFLTMILYGIFQFKVGAPEIQKLMTLNAKVIVLYAVLGINLIYRLFFGQMSSIENGSSITAEKLMAGFAIALILNLSMIIISTNYLNQT